MKEKNYHQEISDIRNLMNRSSRFISLSGLAGIMAGVYALIGAAFAYVFLFQNQSSYINASTRSADFRFVLIDLALVAFLSIATAIIISLRKARKNDEKIWDQTTRRLLLNFLIPLATGGIYILIKLGQEHYGLSAALMLIFYGLALVNASKYTLGSIRYLGYAEIIAGIICAIFPGYGLWFWAFGFGILHIIYGSLMYVNEQKSA
ncbi:hypothetical protein [Mesonia aquimarina]|uniref:hypothetical protein n=1 Tax=Mesonia aquimarina TaxID=1504967 RepID=UPI000EF62B56|nr:hypothetical protein [Mesonia aquimarina]